MALPPILPITTETYEDIWQKIDDNFLKSVESIEIPLVGIDANKIKLKLFDGTYLTGPVIPFPVTGANNGLSFLSGIVSLGGTLLANTGVDSAAFNMQLISGNGTSRVNVNNGFAELAGETELRLGTEKTALSTAEVGDFIAYVSVGGVVEYRKITETDFTSLSIVSNKVRLTFKDATFIETGDLLTTVNTAVNYSVTGTANQLITTTVRPLIITLPAAPQNAQTITVKAITASGGSPITINGNGKNIDGAATATLTSNYASRTLIFNTALNIWLNV